MGTRFKRYDLKTLLGNPELRRHLIVEGTIATQAREGIDVSREQAENSYYVVTEGERASFFGLAAFRSEAGANDGRHAEFVRSLFNPKSKYRSDILLSSFHLLEDSPIAYSSLSYIAPLFKQNAPLSAFGEAWQGVISRDDERYFRFHWEVRSTTELHPWVTLYKGGDYCRFYYDSPLVIDWSDTAQRAFHRLRDTSLYFRKGITWPRRTQRGFSARLLPSNCVFSDKGPTFLPKDEQNTPFFLAILNSRLAEYILKSLTSFGSWEINAVSKIPVPPSSQSGTEDISAIGNKLFFLKSEWDAGNEVSTRFIRPWLLQSETANGAGTLSTALDATIDQEVRLDAELRDTYAQLNTAVYRLYGVSDEHRAKIEAAIGERPPELVWPQMEGKDRDQKRREHVDRLLTYLVKQILEEDEDHLVCLQRVAHEPPLLERLRTKLAACFPEQDPSALETEVLNELKKKTKGYHRAESLAEWLHDVFFETHNALYQQRPIIWHLASSQTRTEPGFACLVHAHHFDADALAKLRSVYVKDRITVLRREAAQAGQDGKSDLRLDLLALAEEVEAYDAKLAHLQEGARTGPEGGERDYRILTPWKTPSERPKGWTPDIDDGIKVNLAPLARTKLLRINLKLGEAAADD